MTTTSRVRWTAALALVLAAGCPLAAQPGTAPTGQPSAAQADRVRDDQAVATLEQVREAIKQGFAAQIRAYFASESPLANMFPSTEGRWVQGPLTDDGTWTARHTGTGTAQQGKDPVDFDALWLTDRVSWVDHETETFYSRPLTRGNQPGAAIQRAKDPLDRVEALAQGFREALSDAAAIEAADPVEIEGVECDAVRITLQEGGDAMLYYFGADDHLPRRAEIILPDNPMLSGAMRVDFTNPVAGPDATRPSDFEIYTPDGYTEDISRALGGEGPQTVAPTRQVAPTKPAAGGAPEWMVMDTEGVSVSPSSLNGKVAVLYFWGTWSPQAKKATPGVASLVADYQDEPVEVISMAFRENDPSTVTAAAAEQNQTWRQVTEADDAAKILGVRLAPSIVVLGQNGELLFKSGRPSGDYEETFSRVRAIIDQALKAGPTTESRRGPGAAGAGDRVNPANASRVGKPRVIRRNGDD